MSDGADRLASESDGLDGFELRGFLAGAAFGFGKSLTHFGWEHAGDQHARETGDLFRCAPPIFEQTRLSFRVELSPYVRIRMGRKDHGGDLPFRSVGVTALFPGSHAKLCTPHRGHHWRHDLI
jgi:hypothetical protein